MFLLDAASSDGGCFHGDATVQTINGERIAMSQLSLGDQILALDSVTGRPFFDEVIAFADRLSHQDATVTNIELENGATLPATFHHLIYVHLAEDDINQYSVLNDVRHAGTVKPGDSLFSVRSPSMAFNGSVASTIVRPTKVTGVYSTNATNGLYAPLTRSGNIVVNDIVASCYAVATNQQVAHWSLWPLRAWYQLCKHDHLQLFATACSQQEFGIHPYIRVLMKTVAYLGITGF